MNEDWVEKRRKEMGEGVRMARLAQKMTQQELAEWLKCSRAHVNRVENGHVEMRVTQLEWLGRMSNRSLAEIVDPESAESAIPF